MGLASNFGFRVDLQNMDKCPENVLDAMEFLKLLETCAGTIGAIVLFTEMRDLGQMKNNSTLALAQKAALLTASAGTVYTLARSYGASDLDIEEHHLEYFLTTPLFQTAYCVVGFKYLMDHYGQYIPF